MRIYQSPCKRVSGCGQSRVLVSAALALFNLLYEKNALRAFFSYNKLNFQAWWSRATKRDGWRQPSRLAVATGAPHVIES
jgi:hypothetical protein